MKTSFGKLHSGEEAFLYTISCGGITAAVTDYGANLVKLLVPDAKGAAADVVLGYDDWDSYLSSVTRVVVGDYAFYGQQAEELLLAMKADCELGRMGIFSDDDYQGSVHIIRGDDWEYCTVYSSCNYTVSWLNKHCPGWDY